MSTGTPPTAQSHILPPPPDPRRLWPEESITGLNDLCNIVRGLCDLVQQHGRDIQELKSQVAALRAEAAIVQEGKSAFIARLTSAAHDWDANLAPSHEPEEAEQYQEEYEEEYSEEYEEEYQEENEGEHVSGRQRRH